MQFSSSRFRIVRNICVFQLNRLNRLIRRLDARHCRVCGQYICRTPRDAPLVRHCPQGT